MVLDLPVAVVQTTIRKLGREFMSFPEQNIDAFVELLIHQRSLFTPENLAERDRVVTVVTRLDAPVKLWGSARKVDQHPSRRVRCGFAR